MIKKNVSYKNLDGGTEIEEVYLNLNKSEVIELELEAEKPFSELLQEAGDAPNAREALRVFRMIIDVAYGVRSEDGKRLIKNANVLEDFKGSEPYSELLWELISNPEEAVNVIFSILPTDAIEDLLSKNPEARKEYELKRIQLSESMKIAKQKGSVPKTEIVDDISEGVAVHEAVEKEIPEAKPKFESSEEDKQKIQGLLANMTPEEIAQMIPDMNYQYLQK